MKHFAVHYMNKYPGATVMHNENQLDVLSSQGCHVSLRRNGNGMIIDAGADCGAIDKHDVSPIPKDARVFKLYDDGSVKPSEEAPERKASAKKLAVEGKILSIEEYKKLGYKFSEKGEVIVWPQPKVESVEA